MRVGPRRKYYGLLILMPVGFVSIGALGFYSPWWILLAFAYMVFLQRVMSNIRCSRCAKRIDRYEGDLDRAFSRRKFFVGKTCDRCGAPL